MNTWKWYRSPITTAVLTAFQAFLAFSSSSGRKESLEPSLDPRLLSIASREEARER